MADMVCILCPMGCRMKVDMVDDQVRVEGNGCTRGVRYGEQELTNPVRVVTTNVRVEGARLPLCPVKTQGMVGKGQIDAVLAEAKKVRLHAPVQVGDVIVSDVAGTGVALVATARR